MASGAFPFKYLLILLSLTVAVAIGFKVLWYFFMVRQYAPEWFILISGLAFVGAGVWISREWHKLQKPKTKTPEIMPRGLNGAQEKYGLSKAEMEVLQMLVQGFSNMEIANARHVSLNTVKTHVSNIYQKMGVARRGQLLAMLQQQ